MAETRQKPRIEVADLSETLEVLFNGVTVARSNHAKVLFEGSLPARYYVPAADVRLELLRPTTTKTHCPWKGEANYFSIDVDGKKAEDALVCSASTRNAWTSCTWSKVADGQLEGLSRSARPAITASNISGVRRRVF